MSFMKLFNLFIDLYQFSLRILNSNALNLKKKQLFLKTKFRLFLS